MSDIIKEQVRYAYPRYKVYIFGVEVTADCVGINVNSHDTGAPNTCHITLLNELDKYVVTTDDMVSLSGMKGQINIPWLRGLKGVDQGTTTAPPSSRNVGAIKHPLKATILQAKQNVTQSINMSDRTDFTGISIPEANLTEYFGTTIKTYPLADGASVFHSMDPVRIAMRDPFDPSRWYWHFSGFVSDIIDSSDENNTKTLTVVVEDPTKLFRYTRVFLNPGIIDAKVAIAQEDIKVQSFYASFLRGLSLPEIFFTMFFGPDKAGTAKVLQKSASAAGKSNLSTKLRGIGHFAFDASSYFTFGPDQSTPSQDKTGQTKSLVDVKPPQQISGLDVWQTMLDHEVQPSDLYTMATEEDRNSGAAESRGAGLLKNPDGKLDVEAVIDQIGKNPQFYLVDGGRLMMLIPNSLGVHNSSIMMQDILQSYALNSEWHSAGEIMMEVINRIQFIMYATPRGDIVIEPPLFDFDPDDFGLEVTSGDGFIDKLPLSISIADQPSAFTVLANGELKFPGRDRGAYGLNYIILKRDTCGWESAFVDEKVYTMAICPHSIVQNWDTIPNTSIIGDMSVIRLDNLIPLYGIRPAPITPRGYIASKEGSAAYASIMLNKLNADSHTSSVRHIPNIKLWLNRPIYVEARNFIGTTKQVSHAITWGANGDMSTTSDLYSIRTWNGDVSADDPTQPIYTTIGGQGSKALDYAVLFKKASVPSGQSHQDDSNDSHALDQNDGLKTLIGF